MTLVAALAAEGPREIEITAGDFQALTRPLIDRCFPPVRKALRDAALKPEAIQAVVLVGARPKSTRPVAELVAPLTRTSTAQP